MSPVLGRVRRVVEWWGALGIRNSTILLCVAWFAVFVLYLYVRPPQTVGDVTSVPAVTSTTPDYATTYEQSSTTVPTTTTSPTVTESGQVGGTDTSAPPTTTTDLLDQLIPPFLRPETTSSAPN